MIVKLDVYPNAGYSAKQAVQSRHALTVGALRELLADYDNDVKIVVYEPSNAYGAKWGVLAEAQWLDEIDENDEDF